MPTIIFFVVLLVIWAFSSLETDFQCFFVVTDFSSSVSDYDLSENDEVTHILHVHQDLDPLTTPTKPAVATTSSSINKDDKNDEGDEQRTKDS